MSRKPWVVYPNEYPLDAQESPLWLAAKGGCLREVMRLISNDKDIEEPGGYMHCSPLAIASMHDHSLVVLELLEHHADLLSTDRYFTETPLHCAVRHYNSRIKTSGEMQDQSAKCNSKLNIIPYTGVTLKSKSNGAACILIESMALKGVTLDTKDECGRTALHLAVADKNEEIVKRLLDSGADISVKDVANTTVLKHCILENDIHFAEILIGYGADVNELYNHGRMPLHVSIGCRLNELSKLLLVHGADIETNDFGGLNASALASQNGWDRGIQLIRTERLRRANKEIVQSPRMVYVMASS